MSEQLTTPATLLLTAVGTPMLPIASSNPLNDPSNNSAKSSKSSGHIQISYSCTIELPTEVPLSSVVGYQYYAGNGSTTIEIYFDYNYSGRLSGETKSWEIQAAVLSKDASGANIPLVSILNLFSMMYAASGPKTSRGTVVTVRIADPA